jgi:hypothetical protein
VSAFVSSCPNCGRAITDTPCGFTHKTWGEDHVLRLRREAEWRALQRDRALEATPTIKAAPVGPRWPNNENGPGICAKIAPAEPRRARLQTSCWAPYDIIDSLEDA